MGSADRQFPSERQFVERWSLGLLARDRRVCSGRRNVCRALHIVRVSGYYSWRSGKSGRGGPLFARKTGIWGRSVKQIHDESPDKGYNGADFRDATWHGINAIAS